MSEASLALVSALIAAIVGSTLGAFSQYFFQFLAPERIKEKRQLRRVAEKYSNPILLSARELVGNISNIVNHDAYVALHENWNPPEHWPITHEYFTTSTMYLFARHFCWVDIFRKEIQFLDFGEDDRNNRIRDLVEGVEKSLSSDSLNTKRKPDVQVYRLQQRAIGEIMTVDRGEERICRPYSEFRRRLAEEDFFSWVRPLSALVLNIGQDDGTFRWERLLHVRSALARLALELDPEGRRVGKETLSSYEALLGITEHATSGSEKTAGSLFAAMRRFGR